MAFSFIRYDLGEQSTFVDHADILFFVQSLVDLSWPTLGWRSTWATAYSASLQYSSAQQVHLFRNCIPRCRGMYPEVVVNLRRTRIESNVSGAWAELETETNCWAGSGFYLLTKNRCCQDSFDKIVKHCRCEVCHIFTFIILTFNKSEAFEANKESIFLNFLLLQIP